jgi:hypothetical protein
MPMTNTARNCTTGFSPPTTPESDEMTESMMSLS